MIPVKIFPLKLPNFPTVNYGNHSFKYSAAKLWNELDKEYKRGREMKSYNAMINRWNFFYICMLL